MKSRKLYATNLHVMVLVFVTMALLPGLANAAWRDLGGSEPAAVTVLEDDGNFFPPYDAAPVYRPETAEAYPVLTEILETMGGQIDEGTMRKLNLAVEVERRSERQVVLELLVEKGWINP